MCVKTRAGSCRAAIYSVSLICNICQIPMITEIQDYNLKGVNTFRIDVCCRRWIEYSEAVDLVTVADMVAGEKYMCIGEGSNLLFLGDYDGAILHSRILDAEMTSDGSVTYLRAGSGISMDSLIGQCCVNGLWGLENLSGIPGETGASAVQNVGAYGVEAKDVISSVECFDMVKREFVRFDADECDYAYRWSMFKRPELKNRYIVTYVTFRLSAIPAPCLSYGNLAAQCGDISSLTPMVVRNAVMALRESKLPSVEEIGSAGSFFKNPVVDRNVFDDVRRIAGDDTVVPHYDMGDKVKIPAAWLIEQCGFKGRSFGNVGVWHKQPLVIVNLTGKASSDEVLEFEEMIVKRIEELFGITLTPEVEHIK